MLAGSYIKMDLDDEEEGVTADHGFTEIVKGSDQWFCIGNCFAHIYLFLFTKSVVIQLRWTVGMMYCLTMCDVKK